MAQGSVAKDIADKLHAIGSLGVLGTSLFYASIPPTEVQTVVVYDLPFTETRHAKLCRGPIKTRVPAFAVDVRDELKNYDAAALKAHAIAIALESAAPFTINASRYKQIRATSPSPAAIAGLDTKDRIRVRMQFEAWREAA